MLCMSLLFSSVAFSIPVTESDELVNVERGVTQTLEYNDDTISVTSVEISFLNSLPTLGYTTTEDEIAPIGIDPLNNIYRYFTFETDNQEVIEKFAITFRIPRDNSLNINPSNVELYSFSPVTDWIRVPSSVSFTTDNYYFFTATTPYVEYLAIGDTNNELLSERVVEESEPVETETESTETSTTQTPETTQNPTESSATTTTSRPENIEYIDDAEGPNYILVVIIAVILILLIGGAVLYVVAKHKAEPTKIHTVDNAALTLKVQELVNKQKSDGEIVNELLDQNYSLDSITMELEKLGRMK